MLHIINQSPFDSSALDDCLRVAGANCSLLFIENGVYALLGLTEKQQQQLQQNNITLYFLQADIDARGLQHKCCADLNTVTDDGFVGLVVEHSSNQSWF